MPSMPAPNQFAASNKNLFHAIISGGGAGLFGAAAAHSLTVLGARLAHLSVGEAGFGAQFYILAAYTGIFYAPIGWAAALEQNQNQRALSAAGGFAVPVILMGASALFLTHSSISPQRRAWVVLIIYTIALWATAGLIGALATRKKLIGIAAGAAGTLAAYIFLQIFAAVFPEYGTGRYDPNALLPSPVNLLDGLFSGVGLCAACRWAARFGRAP